MQLRVMSWLSALVVATVMASPAQAASPTDPCGDGIPCAIDARSYQAKTPPGWDGTSPLPVLIHFHGWGRTGTNVIRNARISGATDANGVLLLAPDGLGKSWSFWGDSRADIRLAEDMLADAAQRWPIDRTRVYVSGFSYGSAMAWALACESGDRYAAVLGIAGTLTGITRRDCPTGPFTLRQVHGKKDTVMRPPWGESGGGAAFDAVLALAQCQRDNATTRNAGQYQRQTWSDCAGGHSVQRDTHAGGHWIPKGWLNEQLGDLLLD